MPSLLHEEQNQVAAKWLKKNGFVVVGTNIWSSGVRERFDVVGFRQQCSVIIESKVSRSDFFADRKKPERKGRGLGTYRFYITPLNMITIDELPPSWGLLYFDGKKVLEIHRAAGNYWSAYPADDDNWSDFQHESSVELERNVLFSLARKLNKKESILT